jgi:hypothetical protein
MSDGEWFENIASELVDAMEADPRAQKARRLLEALSEKRQSGPASETTGAIRQEAERHGISEDEVREMLDEMGF